MNKTLLKKQVKELIVFFEKHNEKEKGLSVREYQNLLEGVFILVDKSAESIDFIVLSEFLNLKEGNDRRTLLVEIRNRIQKVKKPETINYSSIAGILKAYHLCLNDKNDILLTIDEWIEISGSLRALEMERLWFNVKEK